MIQRAGDDRELQTKPCWSWNGADALNFSGQTKDFKRLMAMLPAKQSPDEQISAFLVYLRARFQRWLHQDEFGPTRRQQTAALRALKKSLQTLQRQLAKGARSQREQLDATLRRNDRLAPPLERIYEAASDLGLDHQISAASNQKIDWASEIKTCAETTMAQSQSLDTNADSEILFIAIRHSFDPLQTSAPEFALADAEQWLSAYWNVVDKTLCALNNRGGTEERVSLKLLVEQLCEFWERETGRRVTAHGMSKLEYTQRTETAAGRFVTAAVDAMIPELSWFDEHRELSHSARAITFLPSQQMDRSRQILVIMRNFVKRQSKTKEE
jgi:hypothetical protein